MHNLSNTFKTWTLMAALGGLLIAVGGLIGGQSGLVMAFLFAIALNGFVYWKSDSTSQSSATAAARTSCGTGSAPRATSRAISSASASRAPSSPARTTSGSR